MKGKKNDPVFVAQFIRESVQNGIDTPEKIVNLAKHKIASIDEEIKSIEAKKIIRSKLLDVVNAFEKTTKNKSDDAKILTFFDLQYPEKCKEICESLISDVGEIPIESLSDVATIRFCKKQLLEQKILSRTVDKLVRGERFDEYIKFVLHED